MCEKNCDGCGCNDDREAEAERDVAENRGDFHQVKLRVTFEGTIDMPGATHETDDLENYLSDAVEAGEVVDWEEIS
jgi:hypothetical protein